MGTTALKKLVIKTTLITLASLIGTMIIAFSAVAIFAPGFTAGIFDSVGNYPASVFFYEKQYLKTNDINDLSVLVNKIDIESDCVRAERYLGEMVEHEDFDTFCDSQSQSGKLSLVEYYCGNYVFVLANNGKFSDALTVAENYVNDYSYTKDNPYTVLVYGLKNVTNEQLQAIKDKLELLNQTDVKNEIDYINEQLLG